GEITIEKLENGAKKGLTIISRDVGPGIPDLRKVMEDGFSTSGGLGAGLPGVKRLMDEFSIESTPGEGTLIQSVKWLR
ncbi:ATP-binding protein, partial [Domibacillus iocasae]|uniref:ATP-binding protein n=1 Tax=Domibacillus iocasae TaxID=1714016 RepID=UPI000B1DE080